MPAPESPPVDMEPPPASPVDPPPEPETGRGKRTKRLTWKLLQLLPDPPAPAPELEITGPDDDATPPPEPTAFVWESIKSALNNFGLYREYLRVPTHDPDSILSLDDLSDVPKAPQPTVGPLGLSTAAPLQVNPPPGSESNPYYPFPNSTAWGITNWMWGGSPLKSIEEGVKLVDFLKSDKFNPADLECFNLVKETERLDKSMKLGGTVRDGWSEITVDIMVPDGKPHTAASPVPLFTVPGLFLRPLSEVIKSAIRDPSSKHFHFTPFKQFHQPRPDVPPSRVYDEIYSSDSMIEAYEKLQSQPGEPNCTLERVVLSLMWWSDSTHLANFGNASLWPLYLYFGNLSKWIRGKPSSGACHHVAYIPKLPDNFHDFYTALTGDGPSAEVLAHCKRELMHEVWAKIFDEDFMHAYEHGIVLECHDGVQRRFYPRIFTYSADYPEKVLLACIRNLGKCPCPRCTIPKDKIDGLGTQNDTKNRTKLERTDNARYRSKIELARRRIYEDGLGVKSKRVENLLEPESLVPTTNIFSERLSRFGFNFYKMLVPDFLHEFELGAFKSIFSHLIRILVAHGESTVHTLNAWFVPTFGQAVIRRFDSNASAMKKMAARNFEDLLQCAIPVFEGLLPEPHNGKILSLLFTCAEWHALAKLRMHTTPFLRRLSDSTADFGRQLRHFVTHTCSHFDTRELPKEEAARGRRKARQKKSKPTPKPKKQATQGASKKKTMNLWTYKFHSLGDYWSTIPWFGTSDSYSTQTGEREHRRVKRFYARTNKNTAVRQMTVLERREQALLRIRRKLVTLAATTGLGGSTTTAKVTRKGKNVKTAKSPKKNRAYVDFTESESLAYTAPEEHHHISHSRNFPVSIPDFLRENEGDPAVEDFLPKLKDHLLGRLAHPDWSGEPNEFTRDDHYKLLIKSDRFYQHKVLRVNYTTYDVRRGQDSMNPRTRADIMTLAPEGDTSHPFSYRRIIGIFHVEVLHNVPGASRVPELVEVLWVRNFRVDKSYRAGFKAKRLHRLEFLPEGDPNAFSFLHPDEVIRGAHLIPAFHYGRTGMLLGPSLALDHEGHDDDEEWRYHYVNIFVDRDMYVRYVGGGVGHYQVEIEEEEEVLDPDLPEEDEEEQLPIIPEEPEQAPEELDPVTIHSPASDGPASADGDKEDLSDKDSEGGDEERDSTYETSDDDGDGEGGDVGSDQDGDLGPEDGEGLGDGNEELDDYAPL
ncbi:hypothetical protein C8R46DRAFT_1229045 [Mycena filopes]|nr:hypothetical protein C8R46DRAFT_1229045 [Mycena filopes]